uniref:Uncharacterized protein n=1 Tax=Anguilla anguilla TaxID=7936 RepID=A0A0E9WQA3_ANGAN
MRSGFHRWGALCDITPLTQSGGLKDGMGIRERSGHVRPKRGHREMETSSPAKNDKQILSFLKTTNRKCDFYLSWC